MNVPDDALRTHPGYGVLTAQIHYHFPDYPHIINPLWFLLQRHDICPDFPRLNEFLALWEKEIEGRVSFVRYTHVLLLQKSEMRVVRGVYEYNVRRH